MASFWKRLFGLEETVPPQITYLEKDDPNNLVIDELKKEAMSYEINPYDIANSEMMQSVYDSAGKEYYLEVLEDGKIGYNTLEGLSKHPVISAVIQTRVNQAAEFAQFSSDDDIGFFIKLRDDKEEPSEADIRKMDEIKRFIQDCGSETIDFELTFEGFVRQIVRDSLVYDQCNFEVVRNRRGDVIGFLPVDATTIRRTKLSKEEKAKGRRDPDKPAFCQVIEGKVMAEFGQRDLCFGIRRPRTSMKSKKYGYPELEELINVVRNVMSAEIYNASNFNNGISANGIIAIKSKMDPKLFRVFRREFYQMLTGVNNAKRTPLIQLDPEGDEDIRSISMGSSNREMEYNAWLSYLIKVLCGVYQMDPAEIGFVFGSEGQSSALIQADPTARVLMGKEKGLRPLIRSLQSWINKYVVYQIDPRFELVFNGLDSISAKQKIELNEHRMKYMTINEIRAQHDLDAIEDGDLIAAYYGQLKAKELLGINQKEIAEMKTEAAAEQQEAKVESQKEIAEIAAAAKVMGKNSEEADLNKKKVDYNNNGIEHPAQYFEGLDEETKRKREKEIERRQRHKEKTGEQIYGPLPGDDEIDKAKQNKGTKSKKADEVREEIKKPGKDEFIRAASKVSGVSRKIIETVYDRGLGAAATSGHRPGQTPQSWARARVYAFLFDPQSGSRKKSDKDLWDKHLENTRKTAEEGETLTKGETYVPPKSVAAAAQRALDAKEKHGDKVKGGTQVGWTRARQLANREGISEDTIRRMKAFFDRHKGFQSASEANDPEWWRHASYVSWLLWGSDEGRRWAEMMVARFDKEREEKENS